MTDNRTTELREKLDALGIVHFDYDKGGRTQTLWKSPDDTCFFTYETAANPAKTARLVIEWFPTPEQAIAATLGEKRTCKKVEHKNLTIGDEFLKQSGWDCSECGGRLDFPFINCSYCPTCGAKVTP